MHGHGKLTYATGNIYSGQYFEGMKHGYGKCTYVSGSVYEGQWDKD